jgi:hypothetical protein
MIDQSRCTHSWAPILATENAQMIRQTAASVDKVANLVNEQTAAVRGLGRAIAAAGDEIRQGIQQGGVNVMLPAPANGNGNGDEKPR